MIFVSVAMSGTTGNTKIQLRNAESSVLFLQQQHARTLEGLYSEISKLQKKCGELTFQMAMNSTCISPDEESFQEKCLKTEKELEKRNNEVLEVKKLLENKQKHNNLLEKSLRRSEENYAETGRSKDKKIASLTAELDAKAASIAYLTKQLHDSKVAYAELKERLSNVNLNITERNMVSPAPPGEKAPVGSRRRFVRKISISNDTMNVETLGNGLNPPSPKMFVNVKTAKSSEGFPLRPRNKTPTQRNMRNTKSLGDTHITTQSRAIPDDYTDFLKTGSKPETKLVYKPVPNPLPPILNGMECSGSAAAYRVHRSQGQDAGMVDEFLVSPLNSPDKNWRQGSNQYDSVS